MTDKNKNTFQGNKDILIHSKTGNTEGKNDAKKISDIISKANKSNKSKGKAGE